MAVKILVVPMQIYRKQVDYRVLGYMLAGGIPGVLAGSYILAKLNTKGSQGILYAALGSTVVIMAAANLYRVWLHPARTTVRDWSRWLPAIARRARTSSASACVGSPDAIEGAATGKAATMGSATTVFMNTLLFTDLAAGAVGVGEALSD